MTLSIHAAGRPDDVVVSGLQAGDHLGDCLLGLLPRFGAVLLQVGDADGVHGPRQPEQQRVAEDAGQQHRPRFEGGIERFEDERRVGVGGVIGEDDAAFQAANFSEAADFYAVSQGV